MGDEQQGLSSEECDLVQVLEFYSQPFTLKALAKDIHSTEEHVCQLLSNLGLTDVVSGKRIAERRRIHALARKAYAALACAAKERPPYL